MGRGDGPAPAEPSVGLTAGHGAGPATRRTRRPGGPAHAAPVGPEDARGPATVMVAGPGGGGPAGSGADGTPAALRRRPGRRGSSR
ncbi:hypothetical protein DS079_02825 [Brachybacterium paraconglomeratum]|uniref:Uncharacterized protein n=1 Tax=Brachybacterium paraconglomeratum TaxID=173362 RepID=A0A426SQC7_9MICO|nr:hypothetical protein DS079_02825 [Brachybacterium paraconglomeratum]